MSCRSIGAILCLILVTFAPKAPAQISKANQILIDRGLQIQGMVQPDDYFHLDTYTNANYTSVNFLPPYDSNNASWLNMWKIGTAPGCPWGRWAGNQSYMPPLGGESDYTNQLVSLSFSDEPNLYDSTIFNTLVSWFNDTAAAWPNTIRYINNWGGQITDGTLSSFISQAHPDMISFDTYPYKSVYDTSQPNSIGAPIGGPNAVLNWYGELRRYRAWSTIYNIPFGIYRQTFNSVESWSSTVYRNPSASELRLNTFAALAFNAKMLIDFTYNSGASALFSRTPEGYWAGDTYTNALYNEMIDINKRARNFGKALVRLKPIYDLHNPNDANPPPGPASGNVNFPDGYTTSIMFLKGKYISGGVTNVSSSPNSFLDDPEAPNGYTWWEYQKNDPYLNGWTVVNKGGANNGLPGDVIVSWFTPLDESFDGDTYNGELYMMVVNALTDTNASPAQCSQEITMNFLNSFTAVEMLNPLTGNAEAQVLPIVSTRRQLVLNLNGGDAALFKFSDGAPFVGVPPVITTQPTNRVQAIGTATTFSVAANGLAPINYQWQFNGADIPGANGTNYTINAAQSLDSGSYSVVITNSSGSITSAIAVLTVQVPPQITTDPQSVTVNPGASAVFTVVATGTPAPSYQWRLNGVNIVGATASAYTRTNVQPSDSGNYSVVASNAIGTAASANALLTVNAAPYISSHPQNSFVTAGTTATFNVTAFGPGPLTYRWRKDDNNIFDNGNVSGTSATSLTINNVQQSDVGNYSVVVSNSFGGTASTAATLSLPVMPVITTQPQSKATNGGSTVTFNVVATGGGLSYQWRRAVANTNMVNGGNVSGATTDTLTLSTVSKGDATNYTVVVSNVVGSVTSSVANLTLSFPMPWREPFDYPSGANLGNQTTPSGLVWADVGTTNVGPYVTINSTNLGVPNLAPSYGNSTQFGGAGKSARLTFPAAITSGTTYYSFALKVLDLTGASAGGGFIAGFNNSANTQVNTPTVVGTRLYLRTTTGGFNIGVCKSTDTNSFWAWDPTVFTTNDTIFVVGSYTFNTANSSDDVSKLWINPSSTTFGASNAPSPSLTAAGGADIGSSQLASFVIFQRSTTAEPSIMIMDDLRISSNWASVTPGIAPVTLKSATVLPNGQLQFSGTSDPASIIIQGSSDLTTWTNLTSLTNTSGSFNYIDSNGMLQRFYRAKVVIP